MILIKWEPAFLLWTSSCLVSKLLVGTDAQKSLEKAGENLPCPTTLSSNCYCNFPIFREELGWRITCTNDNDTSSYGLRYGFSDPENPSADATYTLTCVTCLPLVKGFYRQYQDHGGNKTQNFVFDNCPLPSNISLTEVFIDQPVQSLTFRCDTCQPDTINLQASYWNLGTLKSLTISQFNVTLLPDDIFRNLLNLRTLVLNSDNIRELPQNLLVIQDKLETLDLYDNLLEALPDNLLRNMVVLKTLVLRGNRFKEITGETFKSLASLQELQLQGNEIERIEANAFRNNQNLTTLTLSVNKLQIIISGTFDGNTGLTYLDISYNSALSNLPDNLGKGTRNLKELNLSNCNITIIPDTFLLDAQQLLTFKMIGNNIETIPSRLFASSSSLTSLDLSRNRISSLPGGLFSNTSNLRFLSLTNNRFQKFPSGELQGLEQLEVLSLQDNLLTEFGNLAGLSALINITLQNNAIRNLVGGTQLFGRGNSLTLVDLSHNFLQDFVDLDWVNYPSLKTLNLQFNQITVLDVPGTTLDRLDIHLENNNISRVLVARVERSEIALPESHGSETQKPTYYLEDNPLICDCSMLEFRRYIKTMWKRMAHFYAMKDLECSSPSSLANHSLLSVEERDFVCQIEDGCPQQCTCITRPLFNTTEVECVNQNLRELPDIVPANTSVLNVQNNSLESLAGLRKPHWCNLTTLNADGNKITSGGLYFPQNLKSVSLKRNALSVVPGALVTWAKTAESLSLEGNPWQCDCAGLALKQLITDHYTIIPDRDQVFCAKPMSLVQKSIDNLREKDLCPHDKNNRSAYIAALSVCVPMIVLTFVLCVVYFRHRKMIIAYMYIHFYKIFVIFFRESDVDEDKPFHAFVSYSSTDSDVARALVEELEKKEPHFRLCIHERDWLPGQLITWNIVRSVQNSRRTILVLSRDFLKSVWFQLEFHIAYYQMLEDRMDRLIVVVNGDLPDRQELDGDLQFLLSTKSYLVWNERWFWEKLRYALPHKKGPADVPSGKPDVQGPSSELLHKIESKIMSLTQETVRDVVPCTDEPPLAMQQLHPNREDTLVPKRQADGLDSSSV